jgi:hypothetical protein
MLLAAPLLVIASALLAVHPGTYIPRNSLFKTTYIDFEADKHNHNNRDTQGLKVADLEVDRQESLGPVRTIYPTSEMCDHPSRDFYSTSSWFCHTVMLAVLLVMMYSFKILSTQGNLSLNIMTLLYIMGEYSFLGILGFTPIAITLSVSFSILWGLVLEDANGHCDPAWRWKKSIVSISMFALTVLWLVAHLLSCLMVEISSVFDGRKMAFLRASGAVLAFTMVGYYLALLMNCLCRWRRSRFGTRKD